MGLKNFSIQLDSPTGAFYAGTTVSGRVLLSLEKPKKIRALTLKVEGGAKVSFTERESVRKSDGESTTESVTYSSEEEYFSNKFKLVGSGSGETEIEIGDHVYPFSCTLPTLLPSSFEGEHGSVKYQVKAVIDRPWKFDHETKLPFNVVAPIDLNYDAKAKEPVKVEEEKSFCCLCCASGPLQLVVALPHTGFVAGQQVPITVELDNASNVQVSSVSCKLRKNIVFIAMNPSRKEKRDKVDLSATSMEGVAPGGSRVHSLSLEIPSDMPFVNLQPCSIITSSVDLKVEAEVSGMHQNLVVEVPLVIGSVAIWEGGETAPAQPLYPTAPQLPPLGFNIPGASEVTPLTTPTA